MDRSLQPELRPSQVMLFARLNLRRMALALESRPRPGPPTAKSVTAASWQVFVAWLEYPGAPADAIDGPRGCFEFAVDR